MSIIQGDNIENYYLLKLSNVKGFQLRWFLSSHFTLVSFQTHIITMKEFFLKAPKF